MLNWVNCKVVSLMINWTIFEKKKLKKPLYWIKEVRSLSNQTNGTIKLRTQRIFINDDFYDNNVIFADELFSHPMDFEYTAIHNSSVIVPVHSAEKNANKLLKWLVLEILYSVYLPSSLSSVFISDELKGSRLNGVCPTTLFAYHKPTCFPTAGGWALNDFRKV